MTAKTFSGNLAWFLSIGLLIFLGITPAATAQSSEPSPAPQELYETLKAKDALLFDIGFNTCDIAQFENLISEDFEFYHDQGGITASKEAFVLSIETNLCQLDYQPLRELVEGSLKVFPLKKDGVLYGALQNGEHRFYALEEGQEKYLTSTARFSHLWLIDNGEWQLARVFSYDHQSPQD